MKGRRDDDGGGGGGGGKTANWRVMVMMRDDVLVRVDAPCRGSEAKAGALTIITGPATQGPGCYHGCLLVF